MKRAGRLMERVLDRETLREALRTGGAGQADQARRGRVRLVSTKTWPDCPAILPRGPTRSPLITSSRSSTRRSG